MLLLVLVAALACSAPSHAGQPQDRTAELRWVDSCDKCDLASPVEAYRLAASYRAKVYRFGLVPDSLYWPQGQRVVLTLKDSTRVSSVAVLGVGPMDMHGRPIRLGIASRWLRQDDLEQGHRGRGGLILAAFPDSALTAKVVAVSLGR
jgi:hypothetical protein